MKYKLNNRGFSIIENLLGIFFIMVLGGSLLLGGVYNNAKALNIATDKRNVYISESIKDPDSEASMIAYEDFYNYTSKLVPKLVKDAENAIVEHEEMIKELNNTVLKELKEKGYDINSPDDLEKLVELIYKEVTQNP